MTVTLKDRIKVEGSIEDVYALLKKIEESTVSSNERVLRDTPDLSKFTYDYSRGYIDGYQEGMKDRNPQVSKTTDNPDKSSKNVKWTPVEDFMKGPFKTKGTYDGPCYVPDYARPDESCQKHSKITRLNNPDVPYDRRLNNLDSPDMTRTEAPYNPFEHDTGIEYWYNQPTCTGDYTPPTSTTISGSTSGTSRCVLWSGASSDTKYDQEKEDEWFSQMTQNYKLCTGED